MSLTIKKAAHYRVDFPNAGAYCEIEDHDASVWLCEKIDYAVFEADPIKAAAPVIEKFFEQMGVIPKQVLADVQKGLHITGLEQTWLDMLVEL